ncbi:MAG TPA: hypothetical protein VER08_09085 [Pyrinomonadaceae bacterium]|nr:hypothetical protein [Pyrinomonadaceae bacterium]
MRRSVSSYDEDNLKPARPAGDDTGLPEHPIYSNFSKHLWTAHPRHGLVQSPGRSRENTNGHGPTRDELSPVYSALKPNTVTDG